MRPQRHAEVRCPRTQTHGSFLGGSLGASPTFQSDLWTAGRISSCFVELSGGYGVPIPSSPGSRALVRGRGARTRRGAARTRRGGSLARSRLADSVCCFPCIYVIAPLNLSVRARLPREAVLSRARVFIRPLAFLVSGSTAESSSSSRALATGNATLGVQGLAGDHHDQDPAAGRAGRRWQQLWSPSTSR